MQMKISILGCGWLGFPLAQTLLRRGHSVRGATTSKEKLEILKSNGIEPFLIRSPDLLNSAKKNAFWQSDLLFLNIPPGRGNRNVVSSYTKAIHAVREQIEQEPGQSIKKVIFASSTSVYPPSEGVYTEKDSVARQTSRPSGSAVLKAEKLLLDSDAFKTIILRFGGLYGYDRHPVRYLAGKKNLPSPNNPVNLIHQDDCIGIVETILEKDFEPDIYNAVSDGHPPRQTLYQSAAEHYNLEPPSFDADTESVHRVISNKKLKEKLNYSFIYPNPLDHTG